MDREKKAVHIMRGSLIEDYVIECYMETMMPVSEDRVVIFGSTGFVGSRLLPELTRKNVRLRIFVRDKAKASALVAGNKDVEIFWAASSRARGSRKRSRGFTLPFILFIPWAAKAY